MVVHQLSVKIASKYLRQTIHRESVNGFHQKEVIQLNGDREHNIQQANEARKTLDDIANERKMKGNANVTAGRYGEMVANMVKYTESQMALQMINQEDKTSPSSTAPLYQGPDAQSLPSRQHVEPESLRGENVINPT